MGSSPTLAGICVGVGVQSNGIGLAGFGYFRGQFAKLAPVGVVEWKVLEKFLEDGGVEL